MVASYREQKYYLSLILLVTEKHRQGIIVAQNIVSTFLISGTVMGGFSGMVSNRGFGSTSRKRGKYEIGFILGWFLWFSDC